MNSLHQNVECYVVEVMALKFASVCWHGCAGIVCMVATAASQEKEENAGWYFVWAQLSCAPACLCSCVLSAWVHFGMLLEMKRVVPCLVPCAGGVRLTAAPQGGVQPPRREAAALLLCTQSSWGGSSERARAPWNWAAGAHRHRVLRGCWRCVWFWGVDVHIVRSGMDMDMDMHPNWACQEHLFSHWA